MDIEAICWPDYDRPAMQAITVVGRADDGRRLCTLDALRWAEACFDVTQADNLVAAFDEHSAFAYGLAEDVRKRRRAMKVRHGEAEPFVSGFIGIVTIRTELEAVGNRYGLELIRYLKKMHAGMAWYAGLQAAPYDMEHGSTAYRDMRQRLTTYYASDPTLGFKEDAPRSSPGLMTASGIRNKTKGGPPSSRNRRSSERQRQSRGQAVTTFAIEQLLLDGKPF